MYLRPDEVARVLEKAGFTMDVVTQKAYGYRRGDNYVYVNREARMGRTALVIHPALKERSNMLAEPASDIKTCDHYEQFPLYLAGDAQQHYGIPHGFREGANKQVISSQADSLIKISRIWADFFPANTSNQPI
ncbi:DUF2002 family protein [Klebsiella pneumoniae]|nr:DUF2002 family protein [Klebsiella pneumoniae]CAH5797680.1 hypothetical protein AI2631V5_1155 [Klebsiella pneumoniae]